MIASTATALSPNIESCTFELAFVDGRIVERPATQIMPDSAVLWGLLKPKLAVYADGGGYKGKRFYVNLEQFQDHLAGFETLGLLPVHKGTALFLALDIDSMSEIRLVIVAQVLEAMGMLRAAFVTTGSTPEKSKVIITLSHPMPQHQAVRTVKQIAGRCGAFPDFGGIGRWSDHFETFPEQGEGGVVRILGSWKGQHNTIRGFDCRGLDLKAVVPYKFKSEPFALPKRTEPGKATRSLLERPWAREEGHKQLWKSAYALACEARILYGDEADNGRARFFGWIERVRANSPNLAKPSDSGDSRNPLDRDAESAWTKSASAKRSFIPRRFEQRHFGGSVKTMVEVVENPKISTTLVTKGNDGDTKVVTLPPHQIKRYSEHQVKLYEALAEMTKAYHLQRTIRKDYGTLANRLGVDKGSARSIARQADKAELLIIIDPGQPYGVEKNAKGKGVSMATKFALVGQGETRASVLRRLRLSEADIAANFEKAGRTPIRPTVANKALEPHQADVKVS